MKVIFGGDGGRRQSAANLKVRLSSFLPETPDNRAEIYKAKFLLNGLLGNWTM